MAAVEVTHRGKHYTVENAEVFTRPQRPVPIYVSGLGPAAARLAGGIGDGFCCGMPSGELVRAFRDAGGGDKPAQVGMKVCWADTEDKGMATAHRLWRNVGVPGAGFDEIYVHQIGPDQEAFFDGWASEVLPQLR